MARARNKVAAKQRKKKVFKLAKGYWGSRKNVWTIAKNHVEKGLSHAYIGRKLKKRTYRKLWITRINAAARLNGTTYSKFMHGLKQNNIDINRKVLADFAMNKPEVFKAIADKVK